MCNTSKYEEEEVTLLKQSCKINVCMLSHTFSGSTGIQLPLITILCQIPYAIKPEQTEALIKPFVSKKEN